MHRRERRSHLDHHQVAVGHQDGILLRRVVAKPAVLLLGDRRRGVRGVEAVEHGRGRAVDYIRYLRCECALSRPA